MQLIKAFAVVAVGWNCIAFTYTKVSRALCGGLKCDWVESAVVHGLGGGHARAGEEEAGRVAQRTREGRSDQTARGRELLLTPAPQPLTSRMWLPIILNSV